MSERMNRRKFLINSVKGLGTVGLSSTLAQLYSTPLFAEQSTGYRAIVCLFLDGGLDSNSAVVPMDSYYTQYASPRQNLVYQKGELNPLKSTSDKRLFGLHPALVQTANLFNSNEAAILANVGSIARPTAKADINFTKELPTNLFSHSSQIGAWETALAASGSSTGWAGRVADELLRTSGSTKMPAVVSVAGYHLVGQGVQTDQMTASDGSNSIDLLNTITNLEQYLLAAENGTAYNNIQSYLGAQQKRTLAADQVMTDTFKAGRLKTVFPSSPIGQQLQLVAQMIAGRSAHNTSRQIFVARDGSYDSHTTQYRLLSDRLGSLDAAIAAFVTALKEIGMYQNVTLFTCSDFGRSLLQNNNGGSDHAWGGHHFIVGGAVKGGDMYGRFPSLELGGADDLTNIGTWIPTTSTGQYAATLASWLGVSDASLPTIFPELTNFKTQQLSLLNS